MLGMPLIQTKPFKEISLREETPEVKTNRSIINARRNHRGWTLVLEKKIDSKQKWRRMRVKPRGKS